MAENVSTSDVSQCSDSTTKRCIRHHHHRSKHHHHTTASGTLSMASDRTDSTCPSQQSAVSIEPSVASIRSSISLIHPFSSFTSSRNKTSVFSPRPSKRSAQPSASRNQVAVCAVQQSASSVQESSAVEPSSCSVQPSAPLMQQSAYSIARSDCSTEPTASAIDRSATAMQTKILRVVDSCTLSVQSNTLDLIMAMDREEERITRELSDRMRSIQINHEMLVALERFGEEEGEIRVGEEGWAMSTTGSQLASARGQDRSSRPSQLGVTRTRLDAEDEEERRVWLGVPIRPSRIERPDANANQTGDRKKKFLVLAESPFCHSRGTPRLLFAWPRLYPPARPPTLRAITTLLRLAAHLMHALALLHLFPCTEYERTRALPWHFLPFPPPKRREYEIIEPTWNEK